MHRLNPYKESLNFPSLAKIYPSLKKFLRGENQIIDFHDPVAQRTLTQALLKRDFNLSLTLPDNRLCPPVPNRLNYVLWIQDILFPYNKTMPDDAIRGLDIGTGASAIYPLLACSNPNAENWSFVGTAAMPDTDPLSVEFARSNVKNNNLERRITIEQVLNTEQNSIILTPLLRDAKARFDFTMCNPPFYGSADEISASQEAKQLTPNAICTGAETEMITPGGETMFVTQMVHESMRPEVRERCRWFTSMLGKLSSVGEVVGELRKNKVDNYALTQFVQGTTRRWAIAWSFSDERLPDSFARGTGPSLTPYNPTPNTLRHTFQGDTTNLQDVFRDVLVGIDSLEFENMKEQNDSELWAFWIIARENTWSRAARRKRKREETVATQGDPQPHKSARIEGQTVVKTMLVDVGNSKNVPETPCLICKISQMPSSNSDQVVEIQWIRGRVRELFEGFWSHICRKASEKSKG